MFSQRIDFFFFSNRNFLPNRNAKANTQKQHSHIVILSILRQKPIHKFCNAFETILSLCRRFIKLSAHLLAKPLVQTGHHRRYMSDCGIYQTWPLTLSGLSVFAGQVQLAVCLPLELVNYLRPSPLVHKARPSRTEIFSILLQLFNNLAILPYLQRQSFDTIF